MPISMMIAIRSAVGAGSRAVNSPADVKAVQTQLNGHSGPSRTKLTVDGKIGPKTIGAITDFQKSVCGMRHPDGRVDPRGKTETALNDPASSSKFARMSTPAPNMTPGTAAVGAGSAGNSAPATPGGASAAQPPALPPTFTEAEKKRFNDLWALADKAQSVGAEARKFWHVFLGEMASKEVQTAKLFLAAGGIGTEILKTPGYANDAIKAVYALKANGFVASEIIKFVGQLSKMKGATKALTYLAAVAQNQNLAKLLKGAGSVAAVVTFAVVSIEVEDHINKGRYGPAASEAWKWGISVRFPLIALVDAVSTLLEAHYKGKTASPEFKFWYGALRHCNPAAMHGVAVDSVVSTIEIAITSIRRGELDQSKLQALVTRIEQSPLEVFTKIGQDLGDVSYDGYKYVEGGVEKIASDFGAWCVEMDLI